MQLATFCLFSATLAGITRANLVTVEEEEEEIARRLPHFRTWDDVYFNVIEGNLAAAKQQGACPLDFTETRMRTSCYSELETTRRQLRGGERVLENSRGFDSVAKIKMYESMSKDGTIDSIIWAEDTSESFVAGMRLLTVDSSSGAENFDLNKHAKRVLLAYRADKPMSYGALTEYGARGDPDLESVVSFFQDGPKGHPTSTLYWPKGFQTPPDTEAIDELGCMAICLAGCVASDAGVPCWQLCSSTCAWLILTPW